jgi:hypothetical protein
MGIHAQAGGAVDVALALDLEYSSGGDHVDTANIKYTKSGHDLQGVNFSRVVQKVYRCFFFAARMGAGNRNRTGGKFSAPTHAPPKKFTGYFLRCADG